MYRNHFNGQRTSPPTSGSKTRLPGQPIPPHVGFRAPPRAASMFLTHERNRGRPSTQSILSHTNGRPVLIPKSRLEYALSAVRLPVRPVSGVRLPGLQVPQPLGLRSLSAVRAPSKLLTGNKMLYTKPLDVILHPYKVMEFGKNHYRDVAKLFQEAGCAEFGHENEKEDKVKEGFGTFTLFVGLPPELQVKIWGYAAEGCEKRDRNGRRVLALIVRKEARFTQAVTFTSFRAHRGLHMQPVRSAWFERIEVDKRKQGNFVTTASVFETGVMVTCVESRKSYLKTFPIAMPVRKGIVRFNKDTTVYFTGINDFLSSRETPFLPDSFQACLDQVEKLAFPDRVFQVQLATPIMMAGPMISNPALFAKVNGHLFDFVKQFKNLKTVEEVLFLLQRNGSRRKADEGEIEAMERKLKEYKEHEDRNYSIPEVRTAKDERIA